MTRARVAVCRASPETVLRDVGRACELAGMASALARSHTTILKADLTWHFPFPAANTTPWQMEAVILALKQASFDDLASVQNAAPLTDPFKGEELNQYAPLLAKHGVPALYNFREADMREAMYRPKARMHVLSKAFPDGIRIPDYFFGKNIVHLPTMKTDTYTTTSGAMRSGFAGLLSSERHRVQSSIHRAMVDALAIQREIHAGMFAVMDGTTAGNGPGPRTMTPIVKDYVLASADQVALDAVAARMMGFAPMTLEYIAVAHDDRLGVGDPRDIEIVGDDPDQVRSQSWGFEVGDNGASLVGDALWFSPLKRLQKLVFGTPVVNALIAGGSAYHDWYRWPLKDKRTFENWKRETGWGRLFAAYERGEEDRVTRSSENGSRTRDDKRGVEARL